HTHYNYFTYNLLPTNTTTNNTYTLSLHDALPIYIKKNINIAPLKKQIKMVKDLFERIHDNKGPLGKWASQAEGYFVFPKLEGKLGPRMQFQGKEVLNWSINDYLGLATHPEVLKA